MRVFRTHYSSCCPGRLNYAIFTGCNHMLNVWVSVCVAVYVFDLLAETRQTTKTDLLWRTLKRKIR